HRDHCSSKLGLISRRTLIDKRSFRVSPTQFFHPPEGLEMKSLKTYVAAAIAISAIAAIVPVVHAQETTGAPSATAPSRSAIRAANKDLAKRVQKTLYKQKGLESTDVHAVARSGKITLVGMAPDQAQIDLAGKVAESVPGVTSVKNNLTVDEKGR
ncbi:BON domain-containing protein, partial [Burkholderia vietnamiensis]